MLKKTGSPVKIILEKTSGFSLDINVLTSWLDNKWPGRKISLDQLHEAVKSIGVMDYSSDDMDNLIKRLQSVGFTVTK